MMKLRQRSVGLLILTLCVAHAEAQSARPLNPLVARSNRPSGPAPAECEQGLSPAPALRVEVREIPVEDVRPVPEPAAAQAPPSSALRAALQETQAALERNDRPAFDAALARERSLVSTYPTGGERRAAEDILRLHEAAARLWDAQYRSPFLGEDDPEYRLVSEWPGYADAVRRSIYTDEAGRRFYPAGESREFVTRLASERLQRGGMSAPAVTTRSNRSSLPTASVLSGSTPPSTSNRRREVMEPRRGMPRAKRNPVTTSRSSSVARSSSTPSPKPAVTTSTPSSPNPSASPTVTAAPAPAPAVVTDPEPVTTSTPVAGDVPVADTTSPATTDATTADATTADATTADATTTDVVPVTAQPARGRSVILPTILILIGLGVLIVLFRASK